MDSFGKLVGILIGVLLIFLYPVLYYAQKQDAITQTYVLNETAYFVDTVKNSGYMTKEMYNRYLKKLDATNMLYSVKLEHAHFVINPVLDNDSNLLDNEYREHYYVIYTADILSEIYDNSGMYRFNQGDYITCKVSNKTKTFAVKLQELFFLTDLPLEQIYVTYGGAIRDENY